MDPGGHAITIEMIMLNIGFQCMLFINNVNMIMLYFDYLFLYYIKLDEVCDFVMYKICVNLFPNIMVLFISPMTLIHIACARSHQGLSRILRHFDKFAKPSLSVKPYLFRLI